MDPNITEITTSQVANSNYRFDPTYIKTHQVVVSVIYCILLVGTLPWFAASFLKRNAFPLRYRSFPLSALLYFGFFFEGIIGLLMLNGVVPCEYHRLVSVWSLVTLLTTMELYIFRVYFQTRIMQGSLDNLPRFFSKFRILNNNIFFVSIWAIHLIVYGTAWLALTTAPKTTYPDWKDKKLFPCLIGPSWGFYWTAVFLIEIVSILVWLSVATYRSLKGVPDTLLFKRDLKLLSIICGAMIFLYIIFSIVNEPLATDAIRIISYCSFWIVLTGAITVDTFIIAQERAPISPSDFTTTLTRILNSSVRKDFLTFLKSEWTLENLLFYEEVEKYKSKPEPEIASHIFQTYLVANAPRQVNVDGEMVQEIYEQIELLTTNKDTFDRSQAFVFSLMALDSLPRFMRSKGWSTLPQSYAPSPGQNSGANSGANSPQRRASLDNDSLATSKDNLQQSN